MNRITNKTLETIQILKNGIDDDELVDILKRLEDVINLNQTNSKVHKFLDNYSTIEILLFEGCKFNKDEAGFIMDKVLQYNSSIKNDDNNVVITYEAFEELGINKKQTDVLLHFYNNGKLYYKDKNFIRKIIESEKKKRKPMKDAYIFVSDFINKRTHLDEEYLKFKEALKTLLVTDNLIDASLNFYRKKEVLKSEEKEIKIFHKPEKIQIPSRKVLKEELGKLYHPDAKEPYFDLKDINEVLKLLKLLSISDERAKIILNDLYRNAIKNKNYYNYLVNKIKFMNNHPEMIKEIEELRSMDEDSELDFGEWLDELYSHLEYEMTNSFNYEIHLSKSLKFSNN